MLRGLKAKIDTAAICNNLDIIRKASGVSRVIAVVKADAYGHGAVETARLLESRGVRVFAVAYTDEAKALRDAGIKSSILILFDQGNIDDYFIHDLIPILRDTSSIKRFADEAGRRGKVIPVHLKIDTGMGRLGFMPQLSEDAAAEIAGLPMLRLEGVMSHFSGADIDDKSYAENQLELFRKAKTAIALRTGLSFFSHMANSSAVFALPDSAFDAVRPGIALYGYSSLDNDYGLKPAMQISAKIVSVRRIPAGHPVSYSRTFVTKKDSLIAVVSAGYADGFSRLFSNNGEMLVRGYRAPVVGRVCMDLVMLDVTVIPDVSEGDEAVIIGRQGGEQISAADIASRINTISYEVLTSLGNSARKEYFYAGGPCVE